MQRFVAREKADIAVVMFGANDRLDLRDDRGAYLRFHTDAWRDAYAARIGKILSALTDAGLKVIWCGNPIARSPTYSADMGYINTIYEEETREPLVAVSDRMAVHFEDVAEPEPSGSPIEDHQQVGPEVPPPSGFSRNALHELRDVGAGSPHWTDKPE